MEKKDKIIKFEVDFNWYIGLIKGVKIPLSQIIPKILPELRKEDKEYCQKKGIPYHKLGFLDYLEEKYGNRVNKKVEDKNKQK